MADKKSFVFNDETVENSYGFSIANAGIELEQFQNNPVMLNSHENNTDSVIGNWENIRKEGTQLLGDENFDTEDPEAKKIAGKVKRGFIKACSMGIGFFMENMQYIGGKIILTKCVLKEVSIVAVPANAKALRLYDLATGNIITEDQLQLQLSGLKTTQNFNKQNIISMKEILLSATALVALGLTAQPTDASVLDAAITKLKGDLETEKAKAIAKEKELGDKLKAAQDALAAQAKEQTKALLDTAVAEGKITTEERVDYEELPFALAAKTLAKLPGKTSLSALLVGGKAPVGAEPKTFEELMALSDAEKTAFKIANPTKYNQLIEA